MRGRKGRASLALRSVAQGKAQIEPDRVLDDLGGEAMAPVAERGHANILPDPPIAPPVSVTMPSHQPVRRESAICNGSSRLDPPSASLASMLRSTTPST